MSESKKETIIKMFDHVGSFAENKDTARKLRVDFIFPALDRGDDLILDFLGVDSATQSFIHALISEPIRKKGIDVLDEIFFKNCSETIKKIVIIVTGYMQHEEEPLKI